MRAGGIPQKTGAFVSFFQPNPDPKKGCLRRPSASFSLRAFAWKYGVQAYDHPDFPLAPGSTTPTARPPWPADSGRRHRTISHHESRGMDGHHALDPARRPGLPAVRIPGPSAGTRAANTTQGPQHQGAHAGSRILREPARGTASTRGRLPVDQAAREGRVHAPSALLRALTGRARRQEAEAGRAPPPA